MKEASDLEAYLSGRVGKSATKDVKFGDQQLITKGEAIKPEALESLKQLAGERVAALETEVAEKRADAQVTGRRSNRREAGFRRGRDGAAAQEDAGGARERRELLSREDGGP